jgi:hypothetical protein
MVRGVDVVRGALSIRFIALCSAVVVALMALSLLSSGSVVSEKPPTVHLLFAYFFLALKVPINLAVFSIALLAVSAVRGTKLGALQESKSGYVWSVVLTVLVASTVGAFTDLLFSYSSYDVVILPGIDSEASELAVATALVFLSVLASSHFLVGLRRESNLCVSAALALATPVMWYSGYPLDVGVDGAVGVIMIGAILSITALGFLAAWYEAVYAKGPAARPRLPEGAVFRATLGYFSAIAIAFTLSAAVWGIQAEDEPAQPYTTLTKEYDPWTACWEFTAGTVVPDEIPWDDVSVRLTDDASYVGWYNLSESDLTGTVGILHNFGTMTLGVLEVNLVVRDLAGDGHFGLGDRFILGSPDFPEDVRFTFTLIFEPSDGNIAQASFQR